MKLIVIKDKKNQLKKYLSGLEKIDEFSKIDFFFIRFLFKL